MGKRAFLAGGAAAAVLVGLGGVAVHSASADATAVVVGAIDGTSLRVEVNGVPRDIRLLNVKPLALPDGSGTCLADAALENLEQTLPPGTTVSLRYDVVQRDREGRDLVWVEADGRAVSPRLVASGAVLAKTDGENQRFAFDVAQAELDASQRRVGAYSPSIGCTLPGLASALDRSSGALVARSTGVDAAAAAALLPELEAARTEALALFFLIRDDRDHAVSLRDGLLESVRTDIADLLAAAVRLREVAAAPPPAPAPQGFAVPVSAKVETPTGRSVAGTTSAPPAPRPGTVPPPPAAQPAPAPVAPVAPAAPAPVPPPAPPAPPAPAPPAPKPPAAQPPAAPAPAPEEPVCAKHRDRHDGRDRAKGKECRRG
jgi:endonuclease YncB( thermonuclease family)